MNGHIPVIHAPAVVAEDGGDEEEWG
jgi:hypothetical protein